MRHILVAVAVPLLLCPAGIAQQPVAEAVQLSGGSCIGIAIKASMVAVVADSRQTSGARPVGDRCKLHNPRPRVLVGLTGATTVRNTATGQVSLDFSARAVEELSRMPSTSVESILAAEKRWDAFMLPLIEKGVFPEEQFPSGKSVVALYVVTTDQASPRVIYTDVVRTGVGIQINPPTMTQEVAPGKMQFLPIGTCDRYMRADGMSKLESASERASLEAAIDKLDNAPTATDLRAGTVDLMAAMSRIDVRIQGEDASVGPPASSSEAEGLKPWRNFPADGCPAEHPVDPARGKPRTARKR